MFAIILHRKFSLLDATHIHNELFHKRCPYSSIEKGLVFVSLLFNSCIPVCVCLLNVQTFCKHFLDKFLSKTFIIIVFRWQWRWEKIILYIDKTNCTIPYIAYLESINSTMVLTECCLIIGAIFPFPAKSFGTFQSASFKR